MQDMGFKDIAVRVQINGVYMLVRTLKNNWSKML